MKKVEAKKLAIEQVLNQKQPIHVCICTPSVGFMKSRYTASLVRMIIYYMITPILGQEKRIRQFSYHQFEGSMVGAAREEFVRDALAMPHMTHLLFIDEDMGFREDVLNILLSRQMPFVSCNYRMKIPPSNFTCRNAEDTEWITTTMEKNSLEEASMTGFGFSLIERQVLEKMESPMFENKYIKEYKTYSTEDRSFCHQARDKGFPVYVDHKASKKVYHIGSWNYSWDDDHPAYKRQPYAERLRTKPRDDTLSAPSPAA